jgi:general secretion pathway protein J
MKRQQGFTLLEIVIAMTLTAMLLGMLSAGLYSVVNDWKRETSSLDSGLDQALSVLQLDRALQAAFPHTYVDPERLARFVYFEGNEDSLRFVSTVSPQRESAMMAWQLTSSRDDGVQLALTPAFSDNPNARLDALKPVALLPDYTAELRYLVQKNPETKEWLEKWDGTERQSLPIAVHIKFTPIETNSKQQVLEIVAPIRVWRNPEIEPLITGAID